MNPAALTIARSYGPVLAKRIDRAPDGAWRVRHYDDVRTVDLIEHPVAGLAQLEELLRKLAGRPDCAVLRGAPIDPGRTRAVRRLLHDDRASGDRATLADCPRLWTALDFDGLACPLGFDRSDLPACAGLAAAVLPPAFAAAHCIVQATASHGLRDGLRLRLWCWLARPLAGRELKHWLRGTGVDAAVFRPAQLIFTATPLFARGVADPLPERLAVRFGRVETVAPPPPETLHPAPRPVLAPRPVPPAAVTGVLALLAAKVMRATARHPPRHFGLGRLPRRRIGTRRADRHRRNHRIADRCGARLRSRRRRARRRARSRRNPRLGTPRCRCGARQSGRRS